MALDLVQLFSETLVSWNFIILIVGGILAASWLFVRLAGVSTDDMSNIVDKLALIGFPVGIVALVTTGAGLYLWKFRLDYAYQGHELGNSHRISFLIGL